MIPDMAESPGINIKVPHPARVYDCWLGGKDNFAADPDIILGEAAETLDLEVAAGVRRRRAGCGSPSATRSTG